MPFKNLTVSFAKLVHRVGTKLFGRKGLHRVWPFGPVYDWVSRQLHSHEWPDSFKIEGHTVYAYPSMRSGLAMYKGSPQELDFRLFEKEINRGATVIDVGANIGFYGIFFARCVGNNGKVFAFEPEPENLSFLNKNVAENGYTNIEVIPKAVGDHNGEIDLFVCDFNPGGHQVYDLRERILSKESINLSDKELLEDEHSDKPRRSIRVELVSLDSFFRNYRKPIDFVKIDVEGAEGGVLEGMEKILENNKNIKLFFEYWPSGMKLFGTDPEKFIRNLSDRGFEFHDLSAFALGKNKIEPINAEDLLLIYTGNKSTNILAKRRTDQE